MAAELVRRFGLQTEQILVRAGDELAIHGIFRDLDAQRPLDAATPPYSVHALAGAILTWYRRLPVRLFQPLHAKLEKAATTYEASLLLAAQLPQRAGLLFAWLMQLATDVLTNGDVNQVTVAELSASLAPVLIATDNPIIQAKLPRIIATILHDKLDERQERQEALQGGFSESASFDFDDEETSTSAPAPRSEAATSKPGGAAGDNDDDDDDDDSSSDLGFDETDSDEEDDTVADSAPAAPAVADKVDKWSTERVADWLREELGDTISNIDDVCNNFLEDDIDGVALPMLDKADLVRLGITKIGQQKKFFLCVKTL
eukprot:TRINITY_DN588_c0_g1_i1.p1 TRINITY_DN588_c0_g1~~TRINITY_DN588_c0_g1_i1.p1  ORF type:complete len:316 (-),score=196.12 TRINITY_DN588_c0_g1_i1:8-955(-)